MAENEHKQQILDAFGLDDMTDEERAYWEAYDRFAEASRRYDDQVRAAVLENAKAIADAMPEILARERPDLGNLRELGLRFELREGPSA